MFSTYAPFVFTGPLVEKRFNLIHHFLIVMSACDVKVHISVTNVSIANTPDNVVSQPSFHNLDTAFTKSFD